MIMVNIDKWHNGQLVIQSLLDAGIEVADAAAGEPNVNGKVPPHIDVEKNYWLAIDAKDKDQAESIINAL